MQHPSISFCLRRFIYSYAQKIPAGEYRQGLSQISAFVIEKGVEEIVPILKISFLISTALFALFNLVIFNFVGMCTNFTVSAATAVFLLRQKHKQ